MLKFFRPVTAVLVSESSSRSLASAYEAALLAISGGRREAYPDYPTRLLLVQAMTEEGHANGFDAEQMTRVGVSAVEALTMRDDLRMNW